MKSLSPKLEISRRIGIFGIAGVCAAALLASCGGGGGNDLAGVDDGFAVSSQPQALTASEVELLLARAVEASDRIGAKSTIAVTDRVGNVLGVYRMTGAGATVNITSDPDSTATGNAKGLDGLNGVIGSDLAAIAKATTGAYLSSSGNAFSTRTASFIVQEHFAPGVDNTPSGPLFGVQFSQLPCGDLVQRGDTVGIGPKRSPLGLSADPGGFPLYKNGRVVGGIGVMADGVYGLDPEPTNTDTNLDERIAQSAVGAFAAPASIRANRITLGGLSAPYSDSDEKLVPVSARRLSDSAVAGSGAPLPVAGYFPGGAPRGGTAYGEAASGYAPAQGALAAQGAYVLVDSLMANRYPAKASSVPAVGSQGMTSAEVTQILNQALGVANQARAQIRRPVGSTAQVTVSIVDTQGNILGIARTADAPIFGTDVSLQKARTAAFFSHADAANQLLLRPGGNYVGGSNAFNIASYLNEPSFGAHAFFNDATIFTGGTAFSARAIGNIARPFYPDGIQIEDRGPFSKDIGEWSPFNVGLQLDLVYSAFVTSVVNPADANSNCTGAGGIAGLKNGMQIFPGAVPVYRGSNLIGAIGVSGDGVDQDDMISFLGLARAGAALKSGLSNAPAAVRADRLSTPEGALRYAQCPQAPFINSSEQNVCDDL